MRRVSWSLKSFAGAMGTPIKRAWNVDQVERERGGWRQSKEKGMIKLRKEVRQGERQLAWVAPHTGHFVHISSRLSLTGSFRGNLEIHRLRPVRRVPREGKIGKNGKRKKEKSTNLTARLGPALCMEERIGPTGPGAQLTVSWWWWWDRVFWLESRCWSTSFLPLTMDPISCVWVFFFFFFFLNLEPRIQ